MHNSSFISNLEEIIKARRVFNGVCIDDINTKYPEDCFQIVENDDGWLLEVAVPDVSLIYSKDTVIDTLFLESLPGKEFSNIQRTTHAFKPGIKKPCIILKTQIQKDGTFEFLDYERALHGGTCITYTQIKESENSDMVLLKNTTQNMLKTVCEKYKTSVINPKSIVSGVNVVTGWAIGDFLKKQNRGICTSKKTVGRITLPVISESGKINSNGDLSYAYITSPLRRYEDLHNLRTLLNVESKDSQRVIAMRNYKNIEKIEKDLEELWELWQSKNDEQKNESRDLESITEMALICGLLPRDYETEFINRYKYKAEKAYNFLRARNKDFIKNFPEKVNSDVHQRIIQMSEHLKPYMLQDIKLIDIVTNKPLEYERAANTYAKLVKILKRDVIIKENHEGKFINNEDLFLPYNNWQKVLLEDVQEDVQKKLAYNIMLPLLCLERLPEETKNIFNAYIQKRPEGMDILQRQYDELTQGGFYTPGLEWVKEQLNILKQQTRYKILCKELIYREYLTSTLTQIALFPHKFSDMKFDNLVELVFNTKKYMNKHINPQYLENSLNDLYREGLPVREIELKIMKYHKMVDPLRRLMTVQTKPLKCKMHKLPISHGLQIQFDKIQELFAISQHGPTKEHKINSNNNSVLMV